MPVFLERMILPALATVLVIFSVTNPLNWDWPVRVVGSLVVLMAGFAVARMVHRSNQKSKGGVAPIDPSRPQSDRRTYVTESPETLMRLVGGLLTVQKDRLVAPYLGKWIVVSGFVDDVSPVSSLNRQMLVFLNATESPMPVLYQLSFTGSQWADHLHMLTRGSRITVAGQIRDIQDRVLGLRDCELVDRPQPPISLGGGNPPP